MDINNPQFFQLLIDYLPEPVFVKDNDHRVIVANQAFYDIFQMAAQDVIGYTLAEHVPDDEREHFLRIDRNVLDTGESDLREEKLTVGGIVHTIKTSKRRYIDESGDHFLICSIHNITELKSVEKKLVQEKAQLEAALSEIKTLKEILPICSYCRKVRDDEGLWKQLEDYVVSHTDSSFSHSICKDCTQKHFPDHVAD